MITLIDNYDSFTYNLVHYLGELGVKCHVVRNDMTTPEEVLEQKPQAIVLSPGPATPDKAGICIDLIKRAAGVVPVFGVCLGHQAIAAAFGANVVRARVQMHGKLSAIYHDGSGVFRELEDGFTSTRYHSLIVSTQDLPDCLEINARTDDGVIMGLRHKELAVHSVQFHPESIASTNGHKVLKNFLDLAKAA